MGNTARIAGLLCLLEGYGSVVEGYTMRSAVTISEFFISQIIALTGSNAMISSVAVEILRFIVRNQEAEFSPYMLKQRLRSRPKFKKAETADAALGELERAGYIQPKSANDYRGAGRKPQPMYLLHPDLLKKDEGEVMEL